MVLRCPSCKLCKWGVHISHSSVQLPLLLRVFLKIEEDAGRNLRDGKVTASEKTNRSMSSSSDPSNQKSLSCLLWRRHEEVSKSDGRLLWMFDRQWKKTWTLQFSWSLLCSSERRRIVFSCFPPVQTRIMIFLNNNSSSVIILLPPLTFFIMLKQKLMMKMSTQTSVWHFISASVFTAGRCFQINRSLIHYLHVKGAACIDHPSVNYYSVVPPIPAQLLCVTLLLLFIIMNRRTSPALICVRTDHLRWELFTADFKN